MAFKLQRENGEIKEYPTVYGDGYNGIDPDPRKYVTKCGQEWKFDPGQRGGCNHLDCAIYLAEQQKSGEYGVGILFIIFSAGFMVFMEQDSDFPIWLIHSGITTLVGIVFLINGFGAGVKFKELVEYRDKGTIDRMRAWQIYEDF